jgi:photosystem II stability/assembly factor-like uncharacterized protein
MLGTTRAGQRLVAVGERGIILLSDDDGHHWRQASSPVRVTLTAVQFVDAQRGWAVGHLGVVLHSRDGGQTWHKQLDGLQAGERFLQAATGEDRAYAEKLRDDGPDKPLMGLHFIDALHGIVVGAYNLALRTADGGATWQPLSPVLPNARRLHLHAVHRMGSQVLIAGEQGLILRSDDAGQSFTPVPSPYKGSWFGLLTGDDGSWLLYGLRGNLFRSTDRGATWDKLPALAATSLTAGLRRRDGSVLLVSQGGDLLHSADGGRSFTRSSLRLPSAVSGVTEAANGALTFATLRGPVLLNDTGRTPASNP